jgi:DNA primase
LIGKYKDHEISIEQQVEDIFSKKDLLPNFGQEVINKMVDSFWDSPAHTYMLDRGFSDSTMAHFQVGYSLKKNLVAVPIHDWDGNPVGVIGRTLIGKRFENSERVPTRKTLFNLHRAKKTGEKVIVVESSMDAMRIHQAGFPFVVATCGGFFTEAHQQLLNRYFNEIIIMTDNDDPDKLRTLNCNKCANTCSGHNPGRALGDKIVNTMRHKRIRWATYDYGVIYPHNAKDAGDMTEEEIQKCIGGAISAAEMEIWRREFPKMSLI